MKEFTTAIEQSGKVMERLEFRLDGRDLVAYHPTDGQLAMLMASLGRHTNDTTRIAGVIDFLVSVMDESSHQYLVERLLSRDDPMSLTEVSAIIEWMVEEWSGRPTQSPSVSTSSPQSGGQKSKRRTTKSTSSTLVHESS